MGSSRPVDGGRILIAGALLITAALTSCARRPPVLVPPSCGVEAVEGFGSASVAGVEAAIKGKFGFVFRRPGLGRVEALDPIGRTAFLIFFRDGRAWCVLPGKRADLEDAADVMMERFLGVALLPGDAVRLLSGTWTAGGEGDGQSGWSVEADAKGRAARGSRGDFAFTVREFFPGDAVPREIGLSGPGTSGRVKVLKLGFNPPPRPEAFDVAFLRAYAAKTWEGMLELLER
jgi:hypothetical protein